jgi:hypothetical protein
MPSMSDTKSHQFRPPLYHEATRSKSGSGKASNGDRQGGGQADPGWDAYRKWLSKVSAKNQAQRAPVDRSIYSWKGYHMWADRVKQAWKPEES